MENKNMLLEIPFATNLATQENLNDKCTEVQTLINEKIEEVKELIPSGSVDPTKIDEIKNLVQDDVLGQLGTIDTKIDEIKESIPSTVSVDQSDIALKLDEIKDIIQIGMFDELSVTLPEIPLLDE